MIAYLEVTKKLIKEFKEFKINHVPRNLNTEADALANLGSNINLEEFKAIPLVHVLSRAIEKESVMSVYEIQTDPTGKEESSWMKPFKDYLLDKTSPIGKVAAQALALKASKYCLISNVLFKKSVAEIISDNGSQFISNKTTKFCKEWNISLITSTPRHPQGNGQAESSNKVLIGNMRKRLEGEKRKWANELPKIIWADRTTLKGAIGHTLFSLVYECEAVIPTEVEVPTTRYGLMTEERNQAELTHNLDTVEELRED
uniref:Integrase catalytic domain-containing protein n=1 Tax=Chenopodium quinoa TaxID=63459 RepID=A0A803MYZ5_CHEQI